MSVSETNHRHTPGSMTIGWIGVGRMGAAMASRLAAAGEDVTVWNRTRAKAEALTGSGCSVADTIAAVCHPVAGGPGRSPELRRRSDSLRPTARSIEGSETRSGADSRSARRPDVLPRANRADA